MKKLISLFLALAMILMVGAAFANEPDTDPNTGDGGTGEGGETPAATVSTPSITINPAANAEVKDIGIEYIAYRILDASIDTDPVVAEGGSTTTNGTVAYYVTTAARVTELEKTNLFNISRVGTTDKWYVELKSSSTTAEQIVSAFGGIDLSKFEKVEFDKTTEESNAQSGTVAAGYYYITSSLGSKIALQTLTAVIINEKNEYTTDNKTLPNTDNNSEIGQTIDYTLTVNVPATANKEIVLTDTMSKGLTFVQIVSDSGNGTATSVAAAANDATSFTITYSENQVKALVAEGAATITVVVRVRVNGDAAIETSIPNTLDLKYGNEYNAVPVTVNTKTYKVTFDKEDQDGTMLTGAEFKLTKTSTNTKDTADGWIGLVAITEGQTYRLATSEDATDSIIYTIATDGHTVQINGLDLDDTYYLVETKAPTGYNILNEHIELTKDTTSFMHQDVVNNKGTQLPSTGGIGTTIFYVVGGLLLVGAAIVLVARRKANN